jgi:tRNA threonylcarbamoyladenosine biosynthesis protein TsaB
MPSTPGPPVADPVPDTVLALDTTAGLCSVALLAPQGAWRRERSMIHGHSRHALGMVDALLAEAGIAASSIDAIGFGSGPGSFTGLRIACGIAQGLGFGWDLPVVAVDAIRTLGLQGADAARAAGGTDGWVLVALDLRMGEVCHAAFPLRSAGAAAGHDWAGWPAPISGLRLGAPDAAIAAFDELGDGPAWLAGDGFDTYAALGAWAACGERVRAPSAVQPDAAAVARLAAVGLRTGDAALAAPTYLRDKVALDVGEQAALRASRGAAAAEAARR